MCRGTAALGGCCVAQRQSAGPVSWAVQQQHEQLYRYDTHICSTEGLSCVCAGLRGMRAEI